jgi:hypothetical protein
MRPPSALAMASSRACSHPQGARTPTGTYLTLVMNVNGNGPVDFGLGPYRPAADPDALGPVTHLKVDPRH